MAVKTLILARSTSAGCTSLAQIWILARAVSLPAPSCKDAVAATRRTAPWRRARARAVSSILVTCLVACEARVTPSGDATEAPPVVVAYTSVDQVFSEPIFKHCETSAKLRVRGLFDTEETKSTGVLNRLIAEAEHPQADVFWSGDPVRPFVLIERGLVEPYVSPAADGLPEVVRGRDGSWTGFAARARVLLVNETLVTEEATPRTIRALADSKWRGRATMANPLFGTATMHVAALATAWGRQRTEAFLNQLKRNEVRIASSNGEVKRLVASGEMAFGLTDTDDAHEAVASGAPVRVVYPDQEGLGTLIMPTVVVMMRGAPHPRAARRLVDCLLTAEVERRMAESAAHLPLRPGVSASESMQAVSNLRPMKVDYARVARSMKQLQPWLREWVGL